MKTKHGGILAILMAVSLLFTACGKEAEEMSEAKDMRLTKGFVADNSEPLSTLLTKEYEVQTLRDFFGQLSSGEKSTFGPANDGLDLSIDNVNRNFPIECLRYNKNGYYSVYKVTDGGYFYAFWVHSLTPFPYRDPNEEPDATVSFTAHIVSPKKVSDFNPIKEGVSTAEDVALLDPALELMFVMSHAIYSYSLLENGAIMEIEYEIAGKLNGRSDLIVKKKVVFSKEEAFGDLASILHKDLP